MVTVRYRAFAGIQGGHVPGQIYTLVVPDRVFSPSTKTRGSRSVALSGQTQVVVDRREQLWQIETPTTDTSSQLYRDLYEFFESVDEGQRFSMSVGGEGENFQLCIMEGNYQRARNGQAEEFKFSSLIRILPGAPI